MGLIGGFYTDYFVVGGCLLCSSPFRIVLWVVRLIDWLVLVRCVLILGLYLYGSYVWILWCVLGGLPICLGCAVGITGLITVCFGLIWVLGDVSLV